MLSWRTFEMHGQGTFFDPRLNNAEQFPVAARAGFGNIRSPVDMVTAKLPALHFYQLGIPAPKPLAGSFDAAAAERRGGAPIYSPPKLTVRAVTSSRFTPIQAGTCTRPRKSGSTIFKRTDHPIA